MIDTDILCGACGRAVPLPSRDAYGESIADQFRAAFHAEIREANERERGRLEEIIHRMWPEG